MSIVLDDWWKVSQRCQELQRQVDQAEGALQEIMESLRRDFGCRTLKEARAELRRMTDEEVKLFQRWARRYQAFQKKYPQLFTA